MMKKSKFLGIFLSVFAFIPNAFAIGEEAKIGDALYATFEEAVVAVDSEDDIIVLQEDVDLASTWIINSGKSYTVDLNGHTISRNTNIINIDGGSLVLTGTGVVKENTPDNAGIKLLGSDDITDTDYSYLKIGKNVTVEAWAPVFISIKKVGGVYQTHAYGVKVDIEGTLKAHHDLSDAEGSAIYINGTIQDLVNYPVINVADGAVLDAAGAGIYQAGYSSVTVGKATINGVGAGIAVKAGKLELNGTKVKATGASNDPDSYNDGVNCVGAAIQIESSLGYAGNMNIKINGGTYESVNNSAIVEYLAEASSTHEASTETEVESIEITAGDFVAPEGKDVIKASENFKEENTEFISGGTFSSDVEEFLQEGLETVVDEETGEAVVVKRHSINLGTITNGTVKVDKENAIAGEIVTIEAAADKDYTLQNIEVVDANGNKVEVKDGKFVMPDSEISVKITFIEVKSPETSDINLLLVSSVLIVSIVGLVFTLKKKHN